MSHLLDLSQRVLLELKEGRPARAAEPAADELAMFRSLQLLTAKPVLYVCNVSEDAAATGNEASARVAEMAAASGAGSVVVSAKIEEEVAQLDDTAERDEFLESMGLEETGLSRVISAGYGLLGLITFFTVGPKEARAWTVPSGALAPQAAGTIHTDFERGFICAETISYDDFISLGGEQGARDAGKLRQEGRNYLVRDGDIMEFRFNV